MTDLLDRTKEALSAHGGWVKLPELLALLKEDSLDKNAGRQVRAAISASGDIISNSQQGYKLTRLATSDEIRHCLSDLRSRSAELERRARMVEDVARNLPTPEPNPQPRLFDRLDLSWSQLTGMVAEGRN